MNRWNNDGEHGCMQSMIVENDEYFQIVRH
jgi:hypothetical protein